MNFYPKPVKLHDCQIHGVSTNAELFIVEGDSASQAVAAVCNPIHQAVLPMQGKPLNARKAKLTAIQKYELFAATFQALGYPELGDCGDESKLVAHCDDCRYSRIVLLFDPDADGIHCGALMLLFFWRMFPSLLASGMVCLVRAPLYEMKVTRLAQGTATDSTSSSDTKSMYAYSDDEARKLIKELSGEGYSVQHQRYRGLASMQRDTLLEQCVHPESRRIYRMRTADAEAAADVFG